MTDPNRNAAGGAARDWHEAFAALPLETPPRDVWQRLAAQLQIAPRRSRRPWWLALAAAVLLALVLPPLLPQLRLAHEGSGGVPAAARTAADDEAARLAALQVRSAQLEAWLAQVRDERVATGAATALAQTLEARLELIDAALSEPGLAAPEYEALWRGRVETLQRLTAFESGQRLLAAQGERYDGRFVAVY